MTDGSGSAPSGGSGLSETVLIKLIRIEAGMAAVQQDISELKAAQKTALVTREQFESEKQRTDARIKPLERVVYGLVSLVLTAVFVALIALVVGGGAVP